MEKLIAQNIEDGFSYEISIHENEIQSINKSESPIKSEFYIGPGFFDVQVNGYAGHDYNLVQKDYLNLGQIPLELAKNGVTSHFPTVITNSKEQIGKLFQQVTNLIKSDSIFDKCIPGFHMEGPFISPEDGPRGAHFKEFVCPPNWDWFQDWQDIAGGRIKLITLSPEWEGSNSFIEKCVESGVKVSIGHTSANQQQIEDAVQAGASLSTHLGNGANGILPRHPNYIWSQLAEDQLHASIIADGFHLPKEVIKVFQKVKGDQLFLVSDSVALAGKKPGDYETPVGGKVTLTKEGKLHLRDKPGMLAGSAMNLLQGFNFLIEHQLASIQKAWKMASQWPEKYIFPDSPSWEPSKNQDLIILKKTVDSQFELYKTFKTGKEPFPNSYQITDHEQ